MRKLFITFFLLFSIFTLNAQIRGVVKDEAGAVVSGAYIHCCSDTRIFTQSDKNGAFFLNVNPGDVIKINLSDRLIQTFEVTSEEQEFILSFRSEAVYDGFNATNFETTTSAVSAIRSDEIAKHNHERIYSSLYGTIAGLSVLHDSEYDAAPSFLLRGRNPMVLVDGYERSLKDISAEEIESVTVLKDGAAAALYGSEGADGVLLITTKRGDFKKMQTTIDYKFGMGVPHNIPGFVDAATYAEATNEALINDGFSARYTPEEIAAYRSGQYPYLYPNVNWVDEGLRDYTTNHELAVSFNGGGETVRYFAHIDYVHDMGLLAHTKNHDNYSAQQRRNKLSARMNLDVNITKSTLFRINLQANFKENHRPAGNGKMIENLYRIPSNAFPLKTEDGFWGGDNFYKLNPIADIESVGYFNGFHRGLMADMSLTQDFSMWVRGLKAELSVAWDNAAEYEEGNKKPYQYQAYNNIVWDPVTGVPSGTEQLYNEAQDFNFWSSLKDQKMASTFQAKIFYDRSFGLHNVNANVVYRQKSKIPSGRNATRKTQNLMFYGGYNYANRYIVDIVANYFGSSVLLKGNRFFFYPSVSAAWVLSNESWLKDSAMELLKLRVSYGRGGATNNGYDLEKDYIGNGPGYLFGQEAGESAGGRVEERYPIKSIKPQVTDKFNVGVDMNVKNVWDLSVDYFYDHTSGIFSEANDLYSKVLGIKAPNVNYGSHSFMGVDLSTNVHKTIGDFKFNVGGTFSYMKSEVLSNTEKVAWDNLSKIGHRVGQTFGLKVDPNHKFFRDEADIANSPEQTFSEVKPGDIRYVDQNGDNKIDANDRVAMGYSSRPEIYYGINLGFSWKGLGFNLNFQGTGNYTRMIPNNVIYNPMGVNYNNLSKWYYEDNVRWTPATAETANLPRLSTQVNENNRQDSSLWLVDASYFGLRDAYLYYNLPQKWVKKMRMSNFQIYLRGENLFMVDHLKYSDPDSIAALYPGMRNFFVGVNIQF